MKKGVTNQSIMLVVSLILVALAVVGFFLPVLQSTIGSLLSPFSGAEIDEQTIQSTRELATKIQELLNEPSVYAHTKGTINIEDLVLIGFAYNCGTTKAGGACPKVTCGEINPEEVGSVFSPGANADVLFGVEKDAELTLKKPTSCARKPCLCGVKDGFGRDLVQGGFEQNLVDLADTEACHEFNQNIIFLGPRDNAYDEEQIVNFGQRRIFSHAGEVLGSSTSGIKSTIYEELVLHSFCTDESRKALSSGQDIYIEKFQTKAETFIFVSLHDVPDREERIKVLEENFGQSAINKLLTEAKELEATSPNQAIVKYQELREQFSTSILADQATSRIAFLQFSQSANQDNFIKFLQNNPNNNFREQATIDALKEPSTDRIVAFIEENPFPKSPLTTELQLHQALATYPSNQEKSYPLFQAFLKGTTPELTNTFVALANKNDPKLNGIIIQFIEQQKVTSSGAVIDQGCGVVHKALLPDVETELIGILKQGTTINAQGCAATILGHLGGGQQALQEVRETTTSSFVKQRATEALLQLETTQTIASLAEKITAQGDISGALTNLIFSSQLTQLNDEQFAPTIDILATRLLEDDAETQVLILELLCKLGAKSFGEVLETNDKKALKAIEELLISDFAKEQESVLLQENRAQNCMLTLNTEDAALAKIKTFSPSEAIQNLVDGVA